ncbi:hypothetical protein P3C29_29625 [Pseudomonas sp. 1912-s]|uniref:hypothetical protein n=1 Tax=Pseudomonas sp. 1912-s TaxID=3033802 RepID=UPI0023DF7092|nr:hypothetical protein [Pseudomonas sp. 1912-s]MDF3202856.1 hypothetical protein [Pseudomonas sp. 1912-s]
MTLRTTLLALLSWTALAHAEGELMVMSASLQVYNSQEQTINVRNVGDAPLYLSISLLKVVNPGLEPERKVPLRQLDRPGILASPDKLTLGPGQSRAISLRSLDEPAAEELFRLYIVPVRSMQVEDAPQDKISAPMSVAVGYGVLVRHMPLPAKQQSSWSHRCDAKGVTLENTGTVRVVLSDVKVDGGSQKFNVALFPGVLQHFNGKRLSLVANAQPYILECS